MADSKNGDKQRSISPSGSADGDPNMNDDSPSGNPFPGFYGYTPNDGSNSDGSPFFPFPGVYPFANGAAPPGLYPVNITQLAAAGQFPMQRQKRKQVKNACVNCSAACKKCDNNRPCERCKKYGIGDTCLDSARKERKKGVKRGPYKRRLKPGQAPADQSAAHANPDGEWLPDGDGSEQPTTVDPADLPNPQSGSPQGGAYATPEGYYTYPYPYPFPATADGQPPEGYPPPPFFPHLAGGYPPYPPWGQPHPGFDVGGGDDHHGGSARTSGTKKKKVSKDHKKAVEAAKTAALLKKGETAAARASRAARRAGGGPTATEIGDIVAETLDLSAVTDPSLLAEHTVANGDSDPETPTMSLDPQVTTKS